MKDCSLGCALIDKRSPQQILIPMQLPEDSCLNWTELGNIFLTMQMYELLHYGATGLPLHSITWEYNSAEVKGLKKELECEWR